MKKRTSLFMKENINQCKKEDFMEEKGEKRCHALHSRSPNTHHVLLFPLLSCVHQKVPISYHLIHEYEEDEESILFNIFSFLFSFPPSHLSLFLSFQRTLLSIELPYAPPWFLPHASASFFEFFMKVRWHFLLLFGQHELSNHELKCNFGYYLSFSLFFTIIHTASRFLPYPIPYKILYFLQV